MCCLSQACTSTGKVKAGSRGGGGDWPGPCGERQALGSQCGPEIGDLLLVLSGVVVAVLIVLLQEGSAAENKSVHTLLTSCLQANRASKTPEAECLFVIGGTTSTVFTAQEARIMFFKKMILASRIVLCAGDRCTFSRFQKFPLSCGGIPQKGSSPWRNLGHDAGCRLGFCFHPKGVQGYRDLASNATAVKGAECNRCVGGVWRVVYHEWHLQ